jgi:glycosyltransferase involved in cell wall biosynthesis
VSGVARLALDASDAAHPEPTGVGIYVRKLIEALAQRKGTPQETPCEVLLCFRPGPYVRWARRRTWPAPFRVSLLLDPWMKYPPATLFHGMGQRLAKHDYPAQVVTLHDRYPLVSEDYASADFRRLMSGRIEDAIRRATRIIAVSEAVRERLLWYDASLAPKIRVVLHGVDPPQPVAPEELRAFRERTLGLAPDERYFLNVGAIQVRKNIANIALALKHLPGYRLVLAGGDGYGAAEIHALIRREGLNDRIRVLGHMQTPQLRLLYSAASVLVFPSFEETFGFPILEAMSYGLPVITADVAATREIAGGAALLVDPHNVSQISEAMRRVMEDAAAAQTLIEKGHRRAGEFTWEKCAAQTWTVYQESLREVS